MSFIDFKDSMEGMKERGRSQEREMFQISKELACLGDAKNQISLPGRMLMFTDLIAFLND